MSSQTRDELMQAVPYARRYARALTGATRVGDMLVAESLREMLEPTTAANDLRLDLYGRVTRRFNALSGLQVRTFGLSMLQRQLLLLTALEELSVEDAAPIVATTPEHATAELAGGRERLRDAAATDVLIIEDEPVIAMDIEELVRSCGHRVVGVAATEAEAEAIAARSPPGLILADINLGAGGDGSNAVARIMLRHRVPVIFVTAYPERLLTGQEAEPAYVITKPFDPMTLAITTYQAVTGGVRLD